nr:MAG TPA_asm: hypothetical protein [Caudoviricetes sp.]
MLHDWYRIVFLATGAVEKMGNHTQHCRIVQRIAFDGLTLRNDKRPPLHDGELHAAAIGNQYGIPRMWFICDVNDCVPSRRLNGSTVAVVAAHAGDGKAGFCVVFCRRWKAHNGTSHKNTVHLNSIIMRGFSQYAVTCHTASFVSCQPCVTQQAESPVHGHDFTGRLSPHFPHWLALMALMRLRTRASSWRISSAMYSLSSYGSRPGRRSAQFRASISISCSSNTSSSLRSPASAWRARCAALRSAAVLAIIHHRNFRSLQ